MTSRTESGVRSAHRRVPVLALLLAAVFLAAGAGRALALEAGQRGYGTTVFQGQTPERFEVEILGTLEAWGGTGTVHLARLSGGPLERTGVLQGMSGSPVWIDGELVGAVMSTWPFARDAIAGIRPIEEMRLLADDLSAGGLDEWIPPRQDPELVSRLLGDSGVLRARETSRPADGLVWSAGGFAPDLLPHLEQRLERSLVGALQTSGGATVPTGDGSLEAGDAVAVLLVDGDARLYATGTVTERIGDAVLAFGHPFLGLGAVSLPLARAEVVTLMPSQQVSFKMARPVERVGVLRVDRRAGVSGQLGEQADMLLVTLVVEGGSALPARQYRFEVGRMHELTPSLVAWAAQSALLDERQVSDQWVARVRVQVDLEGDLPLVSEAALGGEGLAGQIGTELSLPVALAQTNPDRRVRLESMRAEVRLEPAHRVAVLGEVRVADPDLNPGRPLRVRAELRPLHDQPRWVELTVDVPASLAPGRYRLHVTDGAQAFREEILRGGPRWQRLGLRQIREAFTLRRPANEIVAVLYGAPRSVVVRGIELENLPGSIHSVLTRAGAAPEAEGVAATPLARAYLATDYVLQGAAHITLEIEEPGASEQEPTPPRREGNGGRQSG